MHVLDEPLKPHPIFRLRVLKDACEEEMRGMMREELLFIYLPLVDLASDALKEHVPDHVVEAYVPSFAGTTAGEPSRLDD